MTTFFSVDVEASSLTPGTGRLLTVGVQPVTWFADDGDTEWGVPFYVRINRSQYLDASSYWDVGNPTFDWWIEQSVEARAEAYEDRGLVRHDALTAARMLTEFVVKTEPEPEQRVFVANPVAFDKMWITALYDEHAHLEGGQPLDPFHYRSLCLRSMKFGLRPNSPWGSDRESHEPVLPHHALSDAQAQARDLIDMLTERDLP